MKKIFTMIAMCILLIGCGEENNESGNSNTQKTSGLFTGAFAGNEYTVEVRCSYFDKEYFQFKSDKTDVSDKNGNGIVISGMETNGQFSLTIVDNGKTYSVGNLSNFSKGDNKADGSGKLFEEDTANAHDVLFAVNCG
ncbi:MAG: hypothetical protein KUG75_07620 [Pseudomonadales bacterium]|nr:hypothetical protein [Pseudomonadales bacterium]